MKHGLYIDMLENILWRAREEGGRPSVLGGEVGVVVIECKFKCNI